MGKVFESDKRVGLFDGAGRSPLVSTGSRGEALAQVISAVRRRVPLSRD
jgi:hypothetical protein